MRSFTFITTFLILFSNFCLAGSDVKIGGYVQDKTGKGIPFVNIAVLQANDSSLVKADLTDDSGHFEITIPATGTFRVHFAATSYEAKYTGPFSISGSNFTVPTVVLEGLAKQLKEVAITSRKPMIEVKADKMVFNIENSINATGSNGLELLRKSPGIMVDNNDNISMKGKNGVRIYIDGKPTQLAPADLAAYLKSLNSSDIEAIEMISNPSARYDASGNAGIVNIRLRKNKKIGTNGSVNANYIQGITPKGDGSVSLNYRNKKINAFGNLSAVGGKWEHTLDFDRTQKDSTYIQRSTSRNDERGMNLKTGIDYFINEQQTIGLLLTTAVSDYVAQSHSNTKIYSPSGDFLKTLLADNVVPGSRTNNNLNLNYRYADTFGHELNVDGDYGIFRSRGSSRQPNYYVDPQNAPIYTVINQNYTPTDIDIYTVKADYEQKLGKGKLGLGGKVAWVQTNNTFNFYNVVNDVPTMVAAKSNTFRYTENVNAAYVNYNRELSTKVSLQAGVRMENTASKGELTRADGKNQPDDTITKNYTDLFPSAAITWTVNKKNSLNLTYSRRIDRPTYQDLNPFENKLDELTYQKGNAFLRPQYSNIAELTHTFMGFVNTTLSYTHVHDYATEVTDTVGNAGFVQSRNLATQQVLSLSLGAPIPIAKCCTGYVSLWYTNQYFEGMIGSNSVKVTIPSYGAYMQQGFSLGRDYSVELSGWYSGPAVWGVTWHTRPMGAMDLGMQKQFLHKNATFKVSVTDMFFTGYWRSESNFGGYHIYGTGKNESRTLRFSLSYRFGSSQVKAARERHTGLESESNRIKGK